MKLRIKKNNQEIELDPKPFASGGEGVLHEVVAPADFRGQVAKVYHANKRSESREAKINYLLQYPPQVDEQVSHRTIIWPTHSLLDGFGSFIGFLMPHAHGEKLEILCSAKIPRQVSNSWRRLAFSHPESLKLRLKACYNLAMAVGQIHAVGRYVLVDLKPDNVIINPDGLVAIVDIDSLEVIENGKVLHAAAVATPEFTPPEYYRGVRPGEEGVGIEWDYYSLAIIFYKLLCGIHPAAGSCSPPYEEINSLGQGIELGLYPHVPSKRAYFKVIPPLHRRFERLDDEIQSTFIQCLEAGHENPNQRPSANDWAAVLSSSPLLLVNRKLPSHSLQLSELTDVNWFERSLSKTLEETDIELRFRQRYVADSQSKGWKGTALKIWNKSIDEYRRFFSMVWGITKFLLIMLGGIGVFALLGGLFSGSIGFAGVYATILVKGFVGILATVAEIFLAFPIFGLLFFSPFIRQTTSIVVKKGREAISEGLRRVQAATIVTHKQQERYYEKEQYRLFQKRIDLREKIERQEKVLEMAKQERLNLEQGLKQEGAGMIEDISTDLRLSVTRENEKIIGEDQKVKALAAEEARALKAILLEYQEQLQADKDLRAIPGSTIRQKLDSLSANGQETELQERLLALQRKMTEALQEVRAQYDEDYEQLTQRQKRYRSRVDELSEGAMNKMQQALDLKSFIKNRNYRDVIRREVQTQEELRGLEKKLTEAVVELREVRRELKRYRG